MIFFIIIFKMPLRTGAEILFKKLLINGVKDVFMYSGGSIMPLIDLFHKQSQIKYYINNHEQCGGHAATGYAKIFSISTANDAINVDCSLYIKDSSIKMIGAGRGAIFMGVNTDSVRRPYIIRTTFVVTADECIDAPALSGLFLNSSQVNSNKVLTTNISQGATQSNLLDSTIDIF